MTSLFGLTACNETIIDDSPTPSVSTSSSPSQENSYERRNSGTVLDASELQIAIPRDVIETFGEAQSQEGVKVAFEIIYASTYAAYQHGFEGELAVDYSYLQTLMTPEMEAEFLEVLETPEMSAFIVELTPVQRVKATMADLVLKMDEKTEPQVIWDQGSDVGLAVSIPDGATEDKRPRLAVTVTYTYVWEGELLDAPPARDSIQQERTVTLFLLPMEDASMGWGLDFWRGDLKEYLPVED